MKKNVKRRLLYQNISLITQHKISLGVIKFINNDKTYIHCPIRHISQKGKIKFGVCSQFKSLENTVANRQKLCNHKFRYHFKGDKLKSKLLHLQASKSIEEVLLDSSYKDADKKEVNVDN